MKRSRILIAEDEALSAALLEHLIKEQGYEIASIVSTGEEAVKRAGIDNPDIVLMDIILDGEIDGFMAARQIEDLYKIPIIYITGLSDEATIEKAKATYPYGYITKPFDRHYLYIALELALHKIELDKERRKAEEMLRKERDLWIQTFNAVPDLITILDRERRIVKVNLAMAAKLKKEPGECIGTYCYESVHAAGEPPEKCPHELLLQDGKAHSIELYEENLGGDFFVTASPLYDERGALSGSVHVARDITGLKHAERELRKAHDELERRVQERTRELMNVNEALQVSEKGLRASQVMLRKLTGSLLTAQESERRRIARELHDDLSQRLAVLAIEARAIEQNLGKKTVASKARVGRMKDELLKISEDIHSLSRQLHPSILEDLGLVQALNSECRSFEKREGIEVKFKAEELPASVPREEAICIYRIIQESLKNIVKHSCAKSAVVTLECRQGELFTTITDTGIGFDPDTLRGKQGIGLAGMKERALLVNGELTLESTPGKGTSIRFRVPLR